MSAARPIAVPSAPAVEPLDRRRPNVSGDLRTFLQHAPVFRRRLGGYDRLQVDTYVRWAEEELAAAGRERNELLLRHARLRADLDEARRLLCHTPDGRDALQVSVRLGSVLATAADQAAQLRADGEAERAAAADEAARLLAEASAEAARIVAEAVAEAERLAAEADTVVADAERAAAEVRADAERAAAEARAEAEARLAKVAAMRTEAEAAAAELRRAAARDAETARLQARDEVLRTLAAAREERRRSEESAAARRAVLMAQIDALEQRLRTAEPPVVVPLQREAPVPQQAAVLPEAAVLGLRDRAPRLPHLGRRSHRN